VGGQGLDSLQIDLGEVLSALALPLLGGAVDIAGGGAQAARQFSGLQPQETAGGRGFATGEGQQGGGFATGISRNELDRAAQVAGRRAVKGAGALGKFDVGDVLGGDGA
jgi:hypothetical protein